VRGGSELEHKFLVDRAAARRILRASRPYLKVEVYDPARPIAYARTIYLDTADGRYLRSCEQRARVRLRLRQYAAAVDLVDPPLVSSETWLELKQTAGVERDKVRIAMSAAQALELITGRVGDEIAGRLAAEPLFAAVLGDLRAGLLAPAATTWYRRLSLAGDDLRLTFDEAIAFCRPSYPVGDGEPAEPSGTVGRERRTVVELKTRSATPRWLAAAFGGLRPAPLYSKFRAAMVAAGPAAARRDGTLPLPVLS
jgi:hypothetical protein